MDTFFRLSEMDILKKVKVGKKKKPFQLLLQTMQGCLYWKNIKLRECVH